MSHKLIFFSFLVEKKTYIMYNKCSFITYNKTAFVV